MIQLAGGASCLFHTFCILPAWMPSIYLFMYLFVLLFFGSFCSRVRCEAVKSLIINNRRKKKWGGINQALSGICSSALYTTQTQTLMWKTCPWCTVADSHSRLYFCLFQGWQRWGKILLCRLCSSNSSLWIRVSDYRSGFGVSAWLLTGPRKEAGRRKKDDPKPRLFFFFLWHFILTM